MVVEEKEEEKKRARTERAKTMNLFLIDTKKYMKEHRERSNIIRIQTTTNINKPVDQC